MSGRSAWTGGSRPQGGGEAASAPEGDPERPLRTEDFDYPLPEDLVARYPADRRDRSRLLTVRRDSGRLEDRRFRDLAEMVPPGDALVLNDTKVFPARLRGRKPTGAEAEVFLLRPAPGSAPGDTAPDAPDAPGSAVPDAGDSPAGSSSAPDGAAPAESAVPGARRWEALVRPGGKLKPGRVVEVADGFRVHVEDFAPDGGRVVRLEGDAPPRELVERHGETPLPPYIDREPEPEDRRRYQTVYAEHGGSVAAPTAGLHFTDELLGRLEGRDVQIVRVTLHAGVGTFRPVEAERPEEHELHPERYRVSEEAAERLNRVREEGGAVWAVGTTSTRTLETAAGSDGRFRPGEGRTDLFIHPPHRFRGVDRLVTNFHLPRSSLLMLVSAFAGHRLTLRAYQHAVRREYRFYSYGDAMAVM